MARKVVFSHLSPCCSGISEWKYGGERGTYAQRAISKDPELCGENVLVDVYDDGSHKVYCSYLNRTNGFCSMSLLDDLDEDPQPMICLYLSKEDTVQTKKMITDACK